ncbi:hypothetical protein F2Q68_00016017 [Brassica cretica]|uniref:Uncharacterized protein n=1 Tax=Brassica cretica TaxID=69181 RepID=A0A8S9HBC8_BRACR|nr:hypothetical protein F2Q68_00016017 [Brassica cretica]
MVSLTATGESSPPKMISPIFDKLGFHLNSRDSLPHRNKPLEIVVNMRLESINLETVEAYWAEVPPIKDILMVKGLALLCRRKRE